MCAWRKELLASLDGSQGKRTLIVTEPVGSSSHRHEMLMNSAALHLGTLEAEVGLIKGNAETQSGEQVSWIWAKLISSC